MSRRRDDWEDEDDRPRRRRDWGDDERPRRRPAASGGMSTGILVAMIVGGVLLLLVLGCGGLAWLGHKRAKEQDLADRLEWEQNIRLAEQRLADADRDRRAEALLPHNAEPPPSKPGFDLRDGDIIPSPKESKFDTMADPAAWRILFRSKNPALWNTNTQKDDDFAIPLKCTPDGSTYLRLRRMDTGEFIIIPMTRARIGWSDDRGPAVRWSGEGKEEYGGYHLGIAEGPVARFTEGQGTIGILMDGFDANPGSGFGHAHHVDGGGQRYSWKGKEIEATEFEIAVTYRANLSDAEKKLLMLKPPTRVDGFSSSTHAGFG